MIRRKKLVAMAAVAGGVTLLFAAGAGASRTIAAGPGAGAFRAAAAPAGAVDLSSTRSVQRYLRSLHVDPRTVVIQRGSHNYAGPNCPGKLWNCTTSHRVVQIASRLASRSLAAVNKFQCTPNSAQAGGTDAGTGTCVLVQTAAGPSVTNQSASCTVSADDSAALTCDITQTNPTGGNNTADVNMTITDSSGPTQTGDEHASISQSTVGRGNNSASVAMTVTLTTADTSTGAQSQEAHNWLNLMQTTNGGSGNNSAGVNQTQKLSEKAGATVAQTQDTTPVPASELCPSSGQPDPAICIEYHQYTGTGSNSLNVNQTQSLTQTVSGVPGAGVTQTQGCGTPGAKDCGIEETGSQSTSPPGSNKDGVDQNGTYKMTAPPGSIQNQDPRIGGEGTSQCCGAGDAFKLNQTGNLTASDPLAFQDQQNNVDDFTDGRINTSSNITTNDQSSTIHCSGQGGCFYTQECGTASEGFCPPNATFTAGGGDFFARLR